MASPSELIRLAAERRRMGTVRRTQAELPREQERQIARPMPTNHASYTRLMQRHDRVRTQHLS